MSLVLEKLCILLSELHRCTLLGCFIFIHAVTTAAEEADEGSTGITIVVLPKVAMAVVFVVLFAVGVCIARKRHKVSDVCEWWWWGGGRSLGTKAAVGKCPNLAKTSTVNVIHAYTFFHC